MKAAERRTLVLMTYQGMLRRQLATVRIYRALAAREADIPHRALLGLLGDVAERHAYRSALHLGIPALPEHDAFGSCVWCWLLVRCGSSVALGWIAWLAHCDERASLALLQLSLDAARAHHPMKTHSTTVLR